MRRVFYCFAAGAAGLMATGYIVSSVVSDARAVGVASGPITLERTSKGDRLPAFAVQAMSPDALKKSADQPPVATSNVTIVIRSASPSREAPVKVRQDRLEDQRSRDMDRDGEDQARTKKPAKKMMDGCEASVSPLSPASASAGASRCVAGVPTPIQVASHFN